MNNSVDKNNNYIVACGPLASGKTSLMKLISETFNYQIINEDLENNLYFSDFYLDMRKWGFHASINFLITAIETQKKVRDLLRAGSVCQDWYVREVHDIYNYQKLEQGILSKRDYQACGHLNNILLDYSVQPNLIVYLKADTNTLWSRVFSRRRQEETEGLTKEYLISLANKYDSWVQNLNVPVISIDTSNLDFVNNPIKRTEIIKLLQKAFLSL